MLLFLHKFIADAFQFSPEYSLHHKIIKVRDVWVIGGKIHETVEAIIKCIRSEVSWLSNDLLCQLLSIESPIGISVIGNFKKD